MGSSGGSGSRVPLSMWLLDGHSNVLWPLLYSALALASAGAVAFAIWCCQTNSIFGLPLRASWLRYIGQVSYCLYLIHLPIYYGLAGGLAKSHIGAGSAAAISLMVVGFVVSLIIASLSWYLFESQILKLKRRLEYRQKKESIAAICVK